MVIDPSLLGEVERYYSAKFSRHGATAAGVDWNSRASQELRFAQLLTVVGDGNDFSLVDYGCGYGALVQFLDAKGVSFAYQGFDLSEVMLTHARSEFGALGEFTSDPGAIRRGDYAVASGIFNVRLSADDGRWLSYILETLAHLDSLGNRGFAFNMLTSYSDADRMRPDLYYGDPCFFFDLCKRRFSRDVALLHDYGLYEFTMIVRKG